MRPINSALQFLRGAGLRFDWPTSTQWQTSLSAHDPNPPITLESAPVGRATFDNPQRLRFAGESTVAVNLVLTTLAVVAAVAAPFKQSDWPNPQLRASTAQLDVPPNLLASALGQAPFKQSEWPLPSFASARRFDDPPNLLGSTLAPAQRPLFTADLQLFRAQRWQLPEAFPNIVLGSTPDTVAPFVPAWFPMPAAVPFVFQSDPQNLLALSPAPVDPNQVPFAQYDWSNPGILQALQFDGPLNLLASTLAEEAPPPAATASEWIVRARRRGRR